MSLPTSFLPAITRVYEVLCQARGSARTITAGRFKARLYPGQDADNQHKEAVAAEGAAPAIVAAGVVPGIVFAFFESGDDGATQEFSDRSDNRVRLRVDVSYATDSAAKRSYGNPTVDLIATAMTQAASDGYDIRRAIAWPPNMSQTQASVDTGIPGGGGIVVESWGPVRFDAANQLVTISIYFRAIVFLAL